jgi:hypothetical protein
MEDILRTDHARAMHLITASGLLNPNLALDELMDLTRQLAELESPTGTTADGGPIAETTLQVFAGSFYIYKQVVR